MCCYYHCCSYCLHPALSASHVTFIMDNADAEWFHNQGFVTSSREVSSCSRVHFHANFTSRGGEYGDKPILVLLHGYPQSSFLWRYAANFLPKDTPMFIPDVSRLCSSIWKRMLSIPSSRVMVAVRLHISMTNESLERV